MAETPTGEEGKADENPITVDTGDNGAPAEGGAGKDPVLSQNEIDSLLGLGEKDANRQEKSGIMALISSALVNYERLPMLEVVFDRLVNTLAASLRNFTSGNADVTLEQITSVRFGDYLSSIPMPVMLSVFKAEEWDNSGLMMVDSEMIYAVVDVLLGGRRSTAAAQIEGRPYTTIERNLVERLSRMVLADMSVAFNLLSPVTFRFDHLETDTRFATIARPANAAVLAKLRVEMEGRGGHIEVLIPYATLEPIRELLLQSFMGEKGGRDTVWEMHLGNELLQTGMKMNAILDEVSVPLREIMSWKPGSRLMLNVKADDLVSLRAGEMTLFQGRMGSLNNRIAVKVERTNLHERED